MPTFTFRGTEYKTRADAPLARMVELPVAQRWLGGQQGKVLEVGNVLAHWGSLGHDVLDKYERHSAVTYREDIATWRPMHKYEAIVCISTIEHVGEKSSQNWKPLVAVYNMLLYCLKPKGQLLLTFPWRRREAIDAFVELLPWTWVGFLHRVGKYEWKQVSKKELAGIRYNTPYKKANAVVIGKVTRP